MRLFRLIHGQHGVDDGPDRTRLDSGPDPLLQRVHDEGLLRDGPGAQRRADHPQAFDHHRSQRQLGAGAAHQSDDDQAALDFQASEVFRKVSATHRIEDDIDALALRPLAHPVAEGLRVPVAARRRPEFDAAVDLRSRSRRHVARVAELPA